MYHDPSQRRTILKLARNAICTYLESLQLPAPPPDDYFLVPRAAFVTLKIRNELRGCIGTTEAQLSLGETIIKFAMAAAFRDPRFPPLSKDEFPVTRLEVSILSPFQEVRDFQEIEVGLHGIQIIHGYARGLLLPQVAVEQGWDREIFLRYVCRKAGLPPDAWRREGVKLHIFSAEVFGEEPEVELEGI